MVRKLTKVNNEIIKEIVNGSIKRTGIKNVSEEQAALLIRLICSGFANHFYHNPDDLIDVGFIRFKKNPTKEEVFAVDLIPNSEGINNADDLYKYYKGELGAGEKIKETMENFVNELLSYSQSQNNKITSMTSKLQERKGGA